MTTTSTKSLRSPTSSSLVSQLRQEAAGLADSLAWSIVESACARLKKTRFERLRRRQTFPINEQEEAYVQALGQYVLRKLQLRREEKAHGYVPNRIVLESEMEMWRTQMDRIEYGLRVRTFSGTPFRFSQEYQQVMTNLAYSPRHIW